MVIAPTGTCASVAVALALVGGLGVGVLAGVGVLVGVATGTAVTVGALV